MKTGYFMRKVLSQCGVIVCFQCRDPQDLEILAPMFAIPNLDFTRYHQPMQLHTGYEILELDELSESTNWNNTDTVGRTITNTIGGSKGIARAISLGLARAIGTSEGHTFGTSEQKLLGESEEETHGISRNQTEGEKQGSGWQNSSGVQDDDRNRVKGTSVSGGASGSYETTKTNAEGENDSISRGTQRSTSEGSKRAVSSGENETITNNQSNTVTVSENENWSNSVGNAKSHTEGRGGSASITHKRIPLPVQELVYYPTDRMATAITDQIWMRKTKLSCLKPGECMILGPTGEVAELRINLAPEVGSSLWKRGLVESFKRFVQSKHDCYFKPNLEPEKWTGKIGTNGSTKSSRRIPATPDSSSKKESSPATRWGVGDSKNSGNGNGSSS